MTSDSALGSPIDLKNIGLAKILHSLRQDLDIHCLLSVNWSGIEACNAGNLFFSQVRYRAIDSIVLGVCKVYEKEDRYDLNSIDGVIAGLRQTGPTLLNDASIKDFVAEYGGTSPVTCPVCMLESTVDAFREQYGSDLHRFKKARNKVIAHSEYAVVTKTVPSYDVMERLFCFGADFYSVIGRAFLGISPDDLTVNRPVRADLERILHQLGIVDVKTEME
ncbi:MAG: hypothetical protein ACE5NA_11135 [Nitrospiraceae bacterium]